MYNCSGPALSSRSRRPTRWTWVALRTRITTAPPQNSTPSPPTAGNPAVCCLHTSILWSPAVDNYYEYLRTFSQELGARIVEMYPPLQGPNDPLPPALKTLLRQPLPAQALTISGVSKHLKTARSAIIVGECGTGKTLMSVAVAHARCPYAFRRPALRSHRHVPATVRDCIAANGLELFLNLLWSYGPRCS